MALTYDGTGGLFTRLGKIIGMLNDVRTHQLNLLTQLADVQGAYSSADAYMIETLTGSIERRISEAGGIIEDLQSSAERTLVEMCYAEANVSSTNQMTDRSLESALVWLIRQMLADSESVDGTTISVGASSAGGSNTGNGSLVVSAEAPNILLSGTNDYPSCRSDLLMARCVQDAQNGIIPSGREVFDVSGLPSYPKEDRRFPAGSGVTTRVTVASASIDAGPQYQNVLSNSDFEDQTSNLPAQWSLVSGTAGTDFLTETSTVYRGASSIRLAATGVSMKIRQQLGTSSGSLGKITPDRPYVISFATYLTAGGTGTVRVSLQDSGGSVLGSFSLSVAHGSMTAGAWKQHSVALYSPRVIGSTVYVALETTTAVATQPIYVDEVVIAEMVPHTPSGPFLAVLPGSTDWNVDDNIRLKVSNNAEGDFNIGFDRLFDMHGRGLGLPANYAGSETILDSLVS